MKSVYFGMVSTRGSSEYTPIAVSSFFKTTPLDRSDRFFLIDNDHSLPPQLLERPEVEPVRNSAPLGFAENVNQIAARALEDHADLVFLNNDLVFTAGWFDPFRNDEPVIQSPLSNREVQYAASVHVIKTQHVSNLFVSSLEMKLSDYQGQEAALEAIAAAHRKGSSGRLRVYVLPFFCVRIPHQILSALGCLDTSFGKAGGEDYDYCLRAYLAGYQVQFVLESWILHFYGKSSWSGVESQEERAARERAFMQAFREKWGEDLFRLTLREDTSVLESLASRQHAAAGTDLRTDIRTLLGDRSISLRL